MHHAANVILAISLLAAVAAPASADPVQWAGNGHWYEAVSGATYTWEQADLAARARTWMTVPGHLATITSQEEQDFVTALLGTVNYWLAGYQDPTSSPPADDWHWQTSEAWSYTNWKLNEPNDYYGPGVESCLQLYNIGTWNDVRCIESNGYLVEYDGLVGVEPTTWGSIKALFDASSK
jgi:hypothetical protein